ncbi:sterol O-acyltransferase [Clonorchis sinensis]|uniref:Sterol O-acyltransferase n=1 Tax=Clonorchis sinensis TaxID=79923 RepID=G7YPI5_CLOSI|nr:sterol O-acyltransferase [Clonorchis sinensis]
MDSADGESKRIRRRSHKQVDENICSLTESNSLAVQRDVRSESMGNSAELHNPQVGEVLHQAILAQLVAETRGKLIERFEEQLDLAMNELIERAAHREGFLHSFQSHSDYMVDKYPSSNGGAVKELSEKVFRQRESVLTELFELSHIRTVYHMFVAVLVLFSLNIICHDLFGGSTGEYNDHVTFFQYAFGGFREVILFWLGMLATTLFVPFLGFLVWCTCRPAVSNPVIFDWIMLVCYVIYQIAFMIIPVQFTVRHQLPPASTATVVLEQVRMFMKSHAFIRTSVSTAFQRLEDSKHKQKDHKINHHSSHSWSPDFSHYLYFLFAPTLVYRESYPRTKHIRWSYVASNFLQVGGCVLLSYYVLIRFCFTEFVEFGRTSDYTLRQFILTSTATSIPGGLVMLLTFFAALHSWLNAFAEMLRFGDRLFYKDWWNSTAFSAWYRTWNVVVHDWLYTYVYNDIQRINSTPRSKSIATAVVFWLSAAVHEYILSSTFRFFYPVLFVFFAFAGYPFVYLKGSSRFWNVLIWVLLFTGWGQMMCLYSMEWYARKNCQPIYNSFIDFFIPHSWFCQPTKS